ncbi:hypothetical protein P154DRAFT_521747 [Amniculicola lignicola CBS 123094]|uniref:Uncharacterized protein n=1 Tax=Amniculicola lignicola CBS 123094 TaxID=1392246 RepID=A0A6A5WJZ3_9PLEO|nr:hypothetical protein P154DRAFT_521747 [Amniculicola lignicola CBS 123094]
MANHIEWLHTLQTNELELGATDAVRSHFSRPVIERAPVSQRKLNFEHRRPRWFREMMTDATGVFFYVYPGIASTAAFTHNGAEPAFGSRLIPLAVNPSASNESMEETVFAR